jgi:sugar lactone lactonase YvrE
VAFDSGGGKLHAGTTGGDIQAWDVKAGKKVGTFETRDEFPQAMVFAPGGRMWASWKGHGNPVVLWDATTGKALRRLGSTINHTCTLAFSFDGRLLAVGGMREEPDVTVWEVATGRLLYQYVNQYGKDVFVRSLAFSRDGRVLAAGWDDNEIQIWELATGGQRLKYSHGRVPIALAFSPDGTLLASGSDGSMVHVCDPFTGRPLHSLAGHRGSVDCLDFSPDGRLLASGSSDTMVLVWDAMKLPRARPKEEKLTAKDLVACWTGLDSMNAAEAFGHMQRLVAAPRQAVALLQERLPPVAAVEPKRLARLLADLDGDNFAIREKASNELLQLGGSAEPALRKALSNKPSPEARRRIERLLKSVGGRHLRSMRAVEVLERVGTDEAREQLEKLAGGELGHG